MGRNPGRATFLSCLLFVSSLAHARELSFAERTDAQTALERVHHRHQIGATKTFEQAMPRAALEDQVERYLKQSAALERYWKTEVTDEMLGRELLRMLRDTKSPVRLQELFAALANDPFRIKECLVRPVLVDRLTRNFYAFDPSFHVEEQRRAEEIRDRLVRGEIDPAGAGDDRALSDFVLCDGHDAPGAGDADRCVSLDVLRKERARWVTSSDSKPRIQDGRDAITVGVITRDTPDALRIATYSVPNRSWDSWWASVKETLRAESVRATASDAPLPESMRATTSACDADDTWDNGSLDDIPTGGNVVWTGTEMLVWNGHEGGRYDPSTDTWKQMSHIGGAPRGLMAWTGSQMLVWSGTGGGRYDPSSDKWQPITTSGAPAVTSGFTAVWTGSRMVVWGGGPAGTPVNTGGRYDPGTDTWAPTSLVGAPAARGSHTAIWTGSRMVVWGGNAAVSSYLNTGGRYDPATDSWAAISSSGPFVPARGAHTAVWTGSLMLVWGGVTASGETNSGGRYDLASDSWTPMTVPPLDPRSLHTAVWTGSVMIVWGGLAWPGANYDDGGRYDPVTNTWAATSMIGAPSRRSRHSAVWTGSEMIVWSGGANSQDTNTGGRYDPVLDTWNPTSHSDLPNFLLDTAIWTGNVMIVWGGGNYEANGGVSNRGSRYDPATDTWSATALLGAPAKRSNHTAIWDGTEMLVWGGNALDGTAFGDGGRYEPGTDTWTSIATTGAPTARLEHTAIWTGREMVIWGGRSSNSYVNTGALYDPTTDTWRPTRLSGAPALRSLHAAVWTGTHMIVWGGYNEISAYLQSGGKYDPVADSWQATTMGGAPSSRRAPTAVWTGSRMLVWGGDSGAPYFNTGGRYDPVANAWSSTATAGAPSARSQHTAVWTGSRMVIWGGQNDTSVFDTGGRYDPVTNTWMATSLVGAPVARSRHTAVWTGSRMLLFGGNAANGGQYLVGLPQPETCDGIDNDCNGQTDEGIAAPSGRPTVHSDRTSLGTRVLWTPVTGATGYDVVSGSLAALRSSGGDFTASTTACVTDGSPTLGAEDTSVPTVGAPTWQLVRAVNACAGSGSYDEGVASQAGSRDAEIAASGAACP